MKIVAKIRLIIAAPDYTLLVQRLGWRASTPIPTKLHPCLTRLYTFFAQPTCYYVVKMPVLVLSKFSNRVKTAQSLINKHWSMTCNVVYAVWNKTVEEHSW